MKRRINAGGALLVALSVVMLCGCSSAGKQAAETEEGLPVINLSENVEQVSALNLSDAVEHVDIVRLETTDQSLIGRMVDLIVTSNDIWIYSYNDDQRVYRFSRDGKFRNAVGKQGQGPGEYNRLNSFYVDDEAKEVYVLATSTGVRVYDYEGNYKRGQTKDLFNTALSTVVDSRGIILHGGEAIATQHQFIMRPIPEDSIASLLWMDGNFNVEKMYKNPAYVGREAEILENTLRYDKFVNYFVEEPVAWDVYDNELTFKFDYTDTIYTYRKEDRTLLPKYAISSSEAKGNYADTHRLAKDLSDFNYLTLTDYYAARDYIYLMGYKGAQRLTYRYDKRDKSVQMTKRDTKLLNRRFGAANTFHYFEDEGEPRLILNDDICGGIFRTRYHSEGKYWVNVLQPGFPEYDEAVEQIKNSPDAPRKQELLNIIDRTDDEDNPILLIGVLK